MATLTEEACCRYCLDSSQGGVLVSPCLCKGTSAYIHIECQKKGYEINESTLCPVCKGRFDNIIEEPLEDVQAWGENSVKNLIYLVPAFNVCFCMYSFIGFTRVVRIEWMTHEAQFALFQGCWQVVLLSAFYGYMIGWKVRNRNKYIYLSFFETPCSYVHLHILAVLYVLFGTDMSKIAIYQLLGLICQCFTHVHVFRHVDVLERINREREVRFIS